MNYALYDTMIEVPGHLRGFLSADLLSQDYWNHTVSVEQYQALQSATEQYFNLAPCSVPPFEFEIKVEDLGQGFPRVPRYYSKQGLIFIWSIDLDKDNSELPAEIVNFAADGLQFKSELQHIKSSCANFVEFCAAQMYLESNYVFVGILKTPGWLKRCSQPTINQYYKLFWKSIIDYAGTRPVIVPTVSFMDQVQQQLNQRTVSFGPYHYKIMQRSGFKRKPLGTDYPYIRMLPTQEVWYHGN